ncbi:hypothetical protein FOA52_009094 [Chlamydomonas sp. UWO 241]|nr:hypothetical protein FOA52_009094 [Chlamydomonas sp. UWO 241]
MSLFEGLFAPAKKKDGTSSLFGANSAFAASPQLTAAASQAHTEAKKAAAAAASTSAAAVTVKAPKGKASIASVFSVADEGKAKATDKPKTAKADGAARRKKRKEAEADEEPMQRAHAPHAAAAPVVPVRPAFTKVSVSVKDAAKAGRVAVAAALAKAKEAKAGAAAGSSGKGAAGDAAGDKPAKKGKDTKAAGSKRKAEEAADAADVAKQAKKKKGQAEEAADAADADAAKPAKKKKGKAAKQAEEAAPEEEEEEEGEKKKGSKKVKKTDTKEKKGKKAAKAAVEAAAGVSGGSDEEDAGNVDELMAQFRADDAASELDNDDDGSNGDAEDGEESGSGSDGDGEDGDGPLQGLLAPSLAAAAAVDAAEETESEEAADEAAKAMMSPEQQAEKLTRTLFVGNVPANKKSTVALLKELFSKYGTIESVRLRSLPMDVSAKGTRKVKAMLGQVDKRRAIGNAYVVFVDVASVEPALAENMALVGDKHIRVDRASAPKGKEGHAVTYDPPRSIFVGNLNFMTQDEELISLFGNAKAALVAPELEGAVEAVRIVRDGATNIGKGFAFVLFRTKAAARAALSHKAWELRKRTLRVTRVDRAPPPPRAGPQGEKPGAAVKKAYQKELAAGIDGSTGKPGDKPVGQFNVSGPADAHWQGTRTKGKGKEVRGPKAVKPGSSSGAGGGGMKPGAKTSVPTRDKGKRPAVLARKALALGLAVPKKVQQAMKKRAKLAKGRPNKGKQGHTRPGGKGGGKAERDD